MKTIKKIDDILRELKSVKFKPATLYAGFGIVKSIDDYSKIDSN